MIGKRSVSVGGESVGRAGVGDPGLRGVEGPIKSEGTGEPSSVFGGLEDGGTSGRLDEHLGLSFN